MRLAGLDIGFSRDRPSTGIAVLGEHVLSVHRSASGDPAIHSVTEHAPYEVIAIDGPLLPRATPAAAVRAVETVFSMGVFQRRCKPGMSHVAGTGRMLREEAERAANAFAAAGAAPTERRSIPQVRPGQMIVEAFPNCFLGVCLPEAEFASRPVLRRGRKFDWLYEKWCERGLFRTHCDNPALAAKCEATRDHDERAALVCLLTAYAVQTGRCAAVGDPQGGWFFLPTFEAWQPWAVGGWEQNARRLRARGQSIELTAPTLREPNDSAC